MLHIDSAAILPDGRWLIKTTGQRRFKVLERGMKDGYNTAKISWVYDDDENNLSGGKSSGVSRVLLLW